MNPILLAAQPTARSGRTVKQLELDTDIRAALTQRIITALESSAQGSTAQLRGSLAEEKADAYSDIDIFWEIPDDLFQESVDRVRDVLSVSHPVESLRSAPDFQNSDRRRLFFVLFKDISLFWRADIDVFALSVQRNFEYDVNNEAARGNDWSLPQSALMNAISAVKALLRHENDIAEQLLVRGFERVGLSIPEGNTKELILKLTEGVVALDSSQEGFARRVVDLHRDAFG